jgi:hypothetical protein
MRTLVAVIFILMSCHAAIAQLAEVKQPRLNYRKLVEGLVSPNKPIRCYSSEEPISIPPNYDWKAQGQIEENRKLLLDHCEEALPFLIEGCTDSRYSQTAPWSDDYICSRSVGWICSEIIASHIEVFREDIRFSDPPHWYHYDFVPRLGSRPYDIVTRQFGATLGAQEIHDWWRKHKGKSLRELQIEAFDWAIEKRKEEQEQLRHEDNALSEESRITRARKQPNATIDESRTSRDISRLVADRDKLGKSDKCFSPRAMSPSLLSPGGRKVVPWNEKGE